jgi:glycosyltransferase involved in cell wall biosynthesis
MRLSICIATYNRGGFIGETLASIVGQLGPGVEIVVVDGASPDDTASVVDKYAARCPAIRYVREAVNSGVDADYDKAVGYAAGEHCWLMTDDDLLAPGAIDGVLEALEGGAVDLLIVDAEIRDRTLTRTLKARRLGFVGERHYGPADADAFLRDTGDALSFIGGVIVRRSAWLARQREPYFGSLFIHVGVIFQSPPLERIKVLGQSLVRIRAGNAMWRARSLEIWAFKWPALIWSFQGYGDGAKHSVTPREPWRGLVWIAHFRAMGAYSMDDYRRWFPQATATGARAILWLVAASPGPFVNFLGVCLLVLLGRGGGEGVYDLVVSSRYSNPASRLLASLWMDDAAQHRLEARP